MIEIALPGRDMILEMKNLILDLNGTLTVDGHLIDGVKSRVDELKTVLQVYLLSSDTRGCGTAVADELGIPIFKVGNRSGEDKLDFLNTVGPEETIVIGNGYNDRFILEDSAMSIAVIGAEGCCTESLLKADLVVNDIIAALELLLNPLRIVATLRD